MAAGSGLVVAAVSAGLVAGRASRLLFDDAVRELDIGTITAHYERELRGYPPFHPRMMLTLLIFNYATGTRSSRKIMARCEQDVACRVIVGEDTPDGLSWPRNTGMRSASFIDGMSPHSSGCLSRC